MTSAEPRANSLRDFLLLFQLNWLWQSSRDCVLLPRDAQTVCLSVWGMKKKTPSCTQKWRSDLSSALGANRSDCPSSNTGLSIQNGKHARLHCGSRSDNCSATTCSWFRKQAKSRWRKVAAVKWLQSLSFNLLCLFPRRIFRIKRQGRIVFHWSKKSVSHLSSEDFFFFKCFKECVPKNCKNRLFEPLLCRYVFFGLIFLSGNID